VRIGALQARIIEQVRDPPPMPDPDLADEVVSRRR
jgi:hypothetical protein